MTSAVNDLTRSASCASRNAERLAAWAERWRARFGAYPPSYQRARAARLEPNLDPSLLDGASDSEPPRRTAEIIPHPALFERHGNQGVRRIPRHRQQRIKGRQPGPPEVA